MEVSALALGPFGTGEDVDWRQAGTRVGDAFVDVDGVVDSHRPEASIGNVGPPNCCVKHHRTGHVHDRSDGAFSDAILVVSADASKSRGLPKGGEIVAEVPTPKDSVVGSVLLDDDTCFARKRLELVLAEERFVGGEIYLVLNENQLAGVINEDCAARVHRRVTRFASGRVEASLGGANKMVDADALSRKEVVLLQVTDIGWIRAGGTARLRAAAPLPELTGGALGIRGVGGSLVQLPSSVGLGKDAGAKEEVDSVKADVAKTKVPAKLLLLRL